MDPREEGFSLSHQIVQEEVMPEKFTPDVSTFEILNALGGVQPTPDNPKPEIQSKKKKEEERRKNREKQ